MIIDNKGNDMETRIAGKASVLAALLDKLNMDNHFVDYETYRTLEVLAIELHCAIERHDEFEQH